MTTSPNNLSKAHFPADLAVALGFPAAAIFFAITASLPRVPRVIIFGFLGAVFVAVGVRLLLERRLLCYLYGALYILIGVATFYVAYAATLFV